MKHLYESAGRRRDDAIVIGTKRANIMKIRPKEQGRRAGLLAGFELFLGLPNVESRKVTRLMEEKRFLRGAAIFQKDDPSDSLYALKEGLVKIVAHSEKGAGTILYILRPTDIFGELLLSEEMRFFTAVADTDALVTILSKGSLVELINRYAKEKIIKATLSSEDNIQDLDKIGKIKKLAFPEVVISVPRSATAVAASELLQNFAVEDLTIEEVPIEDVIRKVFRGVSPK